ncbi:hypothetical protein D0Z08_24310 [Nocardioides immobilis]|uniref:MBG domain-containing protein n=1 Tax=Nocardioides immobilis TaxID=2049295 RepID=A0A417XVR7_9ACTN|nr:MBG domain-containing protein [Nocardioides immobilis]RHW24446.1 hypothetical protein D0Z08_24310 [Nocardioides immobilis]
MSVRKWALPFAIVLAVLGVPSLAEAADPIPVTITVTGAQNYGGQPAFAGSTGVTGLSVSGVTCTGLTSGATIDPTIKALGSYTISGPTCSGGTLSKPGYTIQGYSGSTFSVFRARLTVTAENRTKAYGDANPALGYTITGYVNGQDSSVVTGTPALSTTATTSSNVGSYPITVSAGSLAVPSNNYFFAYQPGTLTVNPKPVTVTVNGAQNYGGTPSFAGKTGVSGVTVSGMTCTGLLSGQTIAPTLPAGSYAVDPATCSGGVLSSTNYAIAGYQSSSYLVFKAALTVTADDASRAYGSANPAFGYTITGFQNGDDASAVSGAPELTTTATSTSDVGSYPITPAVGTLSAGNYRFVYLPGTLEVTPKQVDVTVNGAQNYGGTPSFAGRTGVSGVTVSDVTCTGLLSGQSIAPTLPAGSYAVDPETCSGGVLSSSNHAIAAYQSSSFLVFKAALTVTADDATRIYRNANPAFTSTITGFQNGDDASAVSGAPEITTPATSTSDVGSYPITPAVGTLTSSNYRFVYVPGSLTVTPRPVNVTVTGAQNYGGAPAFSATTTAAGVTVSDVACTALTDGQPIAPTLQVGSGYAIDPTSCSGGTLSSANYLINTYKGSSFVVFKTTLTVTADDLTRTYGFGNPALTYSFSGFQNDDDASDLSGTPSLSTTAGVKSNAGTYPIDIVIGTMTSPNYRFVLEPGTLTVDKRQLTVAADPASRAYGAAPPAYTATFTGFRNGDAAAGLTGAPAFSTPATATSTPGTYPLDVAQGTLDSPNYTFGGFVSSTLTITQGTADIATTKLSNSTLSATVTFGVDHTPVVGSTITFTIGNGDNLACTAVTDSTGRAACTVSGSTKLAIQLNGYTARFPGTDALLPGEKKQGIL